MGAKARGECGDVISPWREAQGTMEAADNVKGGGRRGVGLLMLELSYGMEGVREGAVKLEMMMASFVGGQRGQILAGGLLALGEGRRQCGGSSRCRRGREGGDRVAWGRAVLREAIYRVAAGARGGDFSLKNTTVRTAEGREKERCAKGKERRRESGAHGVWEKEGEGKVSMRGEKGRGGESAGDGRVEWRKKGREEEEKREEDDRWAQDGSGRGRLSVQAHMVAKGETF